MRAAVLGQGMRRVTLALLALVLVAPAAAAYHDCFALGLACAEYDWKPGDAYVDAEGAGVQVGAGDHGSGDFRGRDAYLFAGSTYVAFYDGQHLDQEQTLLIASVAGVRLVTFQMDDRLDAYPSQYHCIALGPGSLYQRCATGLP